MQTVLVLPASDAGPNDYAPTPAGQHAANVRQEPHDGDATILVTVAGGAREVWGLDVSGIPDGSKVLSLRIRSVQKQSTAGGNTYRVGFIIGVDYFQPNHVLGSGSAFVQADDEVPVDPSDGAAWTKERLTRAFLVHEQIDQAQGLPRPRLTECIVLADIIPPGHPHADGTGQAPRATSGSQSPRASGSGQGARAGATSQAPSAATAGQAPRAAEASQSRKAAASGQAPRAVTPADLPTLRVAFASQSPRAAVSGSAARATVSIKAPKGAGE